MPLSAASFLGQVRQIKSYLESHPDASAELTSSFDTLWKAFKDTYTADDFKQVIASGEPIDSNLEELITSALLQLNQERARSTAG